LYSYATDTNPIFPDIAEHPWEKEQDENEEEGTDAQSRPIAGRR
jgi:hypothetical protein